MAKDAPANAGDGFAPRLALFYSGFFLASGVQLPFFPAWLSAKGLDSQAIGLVLAVPMLVRVFAIPVAARIADRLAAPREVLIVAATATAIGYAAVGISHGLVAILVAVLVASLAAAPIMPLADAYALRGLGMRRRAYGPVRLWGSVAFIVANLVGGLALDAIARVDLIWLIVAGFAVMTASAFALGPLRAEPPAPAGQPPRTTWLYGFPAFLAVAAAASLIQASHAVYYGFSAIDWSARGFDGTTIGALWALGVVAEIVLLALSPRLPERLGALGLIGLGGAGGAIRWAAMTLDPPAALLPVLQCLHGLSFGATHLGAVHYLARAAPDRQGATAQGDFSTVMGVVMAAASGLSGALYGAFGSHAYAGMAALAAAGGACALLAPRLGRGA